MYEWLKIKLQNIVQYNIFLTDIFKPKTEINLKLTKENGVKVITANKKDIAIARKRLGTSDSLDGEAYAACFYLISDLFNKHSVACSGEFTTALKISPMSHHDYNRPNDINIDTWRELYILEKTTDLVQNHQGPISLPIMYFAKTSKTMKNSAYSNKRLLKRMKKYKIKNHALFIFNELANYDFSYWLKHEYIKFPTNKQYDVLHSAYFQILAALAVLNKKLNVLHFDLHTGNILVFKVPEGGSFYFKVGSKEYFIPNYGFVFKVWDFSLSNILTEDSMDDLAHKTLFNLKRELRSVEFHAIKNRLSDNFNNKMIDIKYLYSFDPLRFSYAVLYTLEDFGGTPQTVKNFLKQIINITKKDLMYNILDEFGGKKIPDGNPEALITSNLFEKYTSFNGSSSDIINSELPFIV